MTKPAPPVFDAQLRVTLLLTVQTTDKYVTDMSHESGHFLALFRFKSFKNVIMILSYFTTSVIIYCTFFLSEVSLTAPMSQTYTHTQRWYKENEVFM